MKKSILVIFLLLLLLLSHSTYAQIWPKQFLADYETLPTSIRESYDHGLLFCSSPTIGGSPYEGILIKTDINGEILWTKVIKELNGERTILMDACVNTNGDFFLYGDTHRHDGMGDFYLMKLDACGNKEWCNVYGLPNNPDNSRRLRPLPDGGCVVLSAYYSDPNDKRIWLFRFDNQGNLKWKNYFKPNPRIFLDEALDLHILPDSSFLITAETAVLDTVVSNSGYWQTYFLNISPKGEVNWYGFVDEANSFYCKPNFACCTSTDSVNTIFTMVDKLYYDGLHMHPHLCKTTFAGETFSYEPVVDTTMVEVGQGNAVGYLGGNRLAITIQYRDTLGVSTNEVLLTDTLGQLINKEAMVHGYNWDILEVTHDQKVVISRIDDDMRMHVYKFTRELEPDTLYTQPLQYDYLCPDNIVSDTILLDCEIVGQQELFTEKQPAIILYPNPTRNQLNLELPEFYTQQRIQDGMQYTRHIYTHEKDSRVQIFDIQGQLQFEKQLQAQEKRVMIDVSAWKEGLYALRVVCGQEVLAHGKFMVKN